MKSEYANVHDSFVVAITAYLQEILAASDVMGNESSTGDLPIFPIL